jgi:hypothetical protein
MRGTLLLLLTIVSVSASLACDQREGGRESTPAVSSPAESSEPRLATRRSIAGCETNEAARAQSTWVGREVEVKLLWNDLPDSAADLKIPMGIRGIVDGGLAIQLRDFPLQTYYVNLWATSGHLRVIGEDLVLDPCSAEVTAATSIYGSL